VISKAIIVQARMGSSRLPGKSVCEIAKKPLIVHVFDRLKRVHGVDNIILATSEEPEDDILINIATQEGVAVYRGSLKNVQQRFYDAAQHFKSDVIIRVTGDNPLIEPVLIQDMIKKWEKTPVDYIGYAQCIKGIGAELFTFSSFTKVVTLTVTDYEREHVTPPYYQKKGLFNILFLTPPPLYQNTLVQLTVDTERDLEFMQELYRQFYKHGFVSLPQVLEKVTSGVEQ
jgi:spore coat polysaccharide biosynthesis protein SpsF